MIYRDFGKTGLKVSAIGVGREYVWTADRLNQSLAYRTRHRGGAGFQTDQRQPDGQIPKPVYVLQSLPALPPENRHRRGDQVGGYGAGRHDGRAGPAVFRPVRPGVEVHSLRHVHQAMPLRH